MLQNINYETNQENSNVKESEKINYQEVLSRLFTKQNIVILRFI